MIGVIAGAAGGGAVVIAVIVIIVLRRKGIICNGDRGARRRRRREHRSGCCFGCCQREDKRATDWKTVLNSSNAAFEGLQPNTFMKSQIDRDLTGSRTSSMSLISRSSAGTGMVSRQGGAWTAEDVTDTEKDHEMLAAELEEVLVGAEADGVPGAAAGLRKPSADQNILLPGVAVDESEADNSPDKGTSPVPTGGVKATKGSFKTKMAMFENGSDSPTTRHNPLFDELNQDTSVDNLKTIRQKARKPSKSAPFGFGDEASDDEYLETDASVRDGLSLSPPAEGGADVSFSLPSELLAGSDDSDSENEDGVMSVPRNTVAGGRDSSHAPTDADDEAPGLPPKQGASAEEPAKRSPSPIEAETTARTDLSLFGIEEQSPEERAMVHPSEWTYIECTTWLKHNKFEDFVETFYNNGFEGKHLVLLQVESFGGLKQHTPARCRDLIQAIDELKRVGYWMPPVEDESDDEDAGSKKLHPLRSQLVLGLAEEAMANFATGVKCELCLDNEALLRCDGGCDKNYCPTCSDYVHGALTTDVHISRHQLTPIQVIGTKSGIAAEEAKQKESRRRASKRDKKRSAPKSPQTVQELVRSRGECAEADMARLAHFLTLNITREDSVSLLHPEVPANQGVWLVRTSKKRDNTWVLSVVHHGRVQHFQLYKRDFDNKFVTNSGHKFNSLEEMVSHFQEVEGDGLPCVLGSGCTVYDAQIPLKSAPAEDNYGFGDEDAEVYETVDLKGEVYETVDLSGGAGAAVMDEYDSVTPTEKQRQDFMQRANSGPNGRRNTQSNYMPVEIGVMPPPEQRASYMNQSAIDAQRRASVSSGGSRKKKEPELYVNSEVLRK